MRKTVFNLVVLCCLQCLFSCSGSKPESEGVIRMLLGSYGSADKERIQLYEFNENTGDANRLSGLSGIAEASFLDIAPDGKHFYAVSEKDDSTAALFACEISESDTTKLNILNSQPTDGEAPCYVNVEKNGQFAYTANYNGSSFSVFGIDSATDKLLADKEVYHFEGSGPIKERQEKSHIHCVQFTPDSTLLLADDLGMDVIHAFPVNKDAKTANTRLDKDKAFDIKIEPGSGPRHLTFTPNGKHAYLMNELSGMVTVFDYKDGNLTPIQYAKSDSVGAQGSADIHVSPDGKFLYASNRLKADGTSIFSINQTDGKITKIGYQLTGIHPRNFAITPNGKYLLCACRDSNEIQIFERDSTTGLLNDTGKKIEMENPVCVKFLNSSTSAGIF